MILQDNLLREKIVDFLVENNIRGVDASDTADCLVLADLYGVTTHGTAVLPSHFKRIRSGGYNLAPSYSVIRETPSFAVHKPSATIVALTTKQKTTASTGARIDNPKGGRLLPSVPLLR